METNDKTMAAFAVPTHALGTGLSIRLRRRANDRAGVTHTWIDGDRLAPAPDSAPGRSPA
ncbi:hypothetical protein ET495_16625 [Xylanimonas allomyrinae]|uniref:Uncharacterized protein n=1 Tax=Xylanimonas allomyrinae TaxID=2509459 RepID=A0A4P6F2H7_9MICO|nr:hypothetical protein [Xylanimonas allomyrinae]QAY64558.1 hypothetical protein ET495_16625 [Xylanimonas allomyrinae]